jgi:hypothetical protein
MTSIFAEYSKDRDFFYGAKVGAANDAKLLSSTSKSAGNY